MSSSTSARVPSVACILAADLRRFVPGQRVLAPLWVAGANDRGLSGWQGEVIIGVIIDVQDEYDLAPGAEISYWQKIIIDAVVPGGDGLARLERTNYNTIPVPSVS